MSTVWLRRFMNNRVTDGRTTQLPQQFNIVSFYPFGYGWYGYSEHTVKINKLKKILKTHVFKYPFKISQNRSSRLYRKFQPDEPGSASKLSFKNPTRTTNV